MNKLIAIVDDEPDILELVSIHLEKANFKIAKFDNSQEFLKFIDKKTPDLLILDLMLPDIDGLEICKRLKSDTKTSHFPIIMLTARGDEFDKVLGLELGADDYITKPFSTRELVARVKAVLRRNRIKMSESTININDDLVIDLQRYSVIINGHPVDLTSTEFNILKILATKRGWVFSREQLLQHLWGDDKIVISRTIDVHIKHLREKLGPAAHYIKNIRGVGYKLE
jgi:two-component system phosphate regulon response regulator PhoB/two-component system alkaline phosphatase synthesis response regulator PhoP